MRGALSLIIIFIYLFSAPVFSGSAADKDNQHNADSISLFAKNVEQYAAQQGARAFIIGRVGRPKKELPTGVKFTHTAIAVYSSITLDTGEQVKGYAIHNLYQKEGQLDKSELIVDYPVDFFWGVDSLKAGILIPTPALQQRLLEAISSGKNKKVHNESYSVIANPFNSLLQNCTEHTLDVLNASIYQNTDIEFLKQTTTQHFTAQRIKINRFKLLLGDWFVDEVSIDDHQGKIYTTTFSSIGHYLQRYDLLMTAVVLNQDGSTSALL